MLATNDDCEQDSGDCSVKCSGFGVVAKSMQPEGRSQERMSEHDEQETEGDGKDAGAHEERNWCAWPATRRC